MTAVSETGVTGWPPRAMAIAAPAIASAPQATAMRIREREARSNSGIIVKRPAFDARPSEREARHDGRVIARPDAGLHHAGSRSRGQRFGREHVVQAPPDVALPHAPPRRPPGEQSVVFGVELTADVDVASAQDAFDDRAFL